MRVLVIEDDTDKLRRVIDALTAVPGVSLEQIDYAVDVFKSRQLLRDKHYDLLILDLALPLRVNQEPTSLAGRELLEELAESSEYHIPAHVVGLTGHADLFRDEADVFTDRLLTLVYYDPSSSGWIHRIQARAHHVLAANASAKQAEVPYGCDLAIVCALESPELEAVLRLEWNWEVVNARGDDTIYFRGKFGAQQRIVYAGAAARMGMPATAVLATKMIMTFRPRYLAMPGITAGMPGDTRLGDVLVADPVWDWGSGKWKIVDGQPRLHPRPHQLPLETRLRSKFGALRRDSAALSTIRNQWPADKPAHELRLLLGPLASGAAVLADGTTRSSVLEQHGKLLGIEMEAYALFVAASEAPRPRPEVFAIKSVVDFADMEKADSFQTYAAYTSAQVLREFAENHLFAQPLRPALSVKQAH